MPNLRVWPVVAALLVAGCLLAVPAAACTCANGGSRTSTSECLCSCPAGWYPPTCEYTASQQVKVFMHFRNTTAVPWTTSGAKIQEFYDRYGFTDGSSGARVMRTIRRLTAQEPSDGSIIKIVVGVRGDQVHRVVSDFDASSAFSTRIELVALGYFNPPAAAPGALAGSPVLGEFKVMNNTVPVPLHAVAFPFGALLILIVLPVSERLFTCCCESGEQERERHDDPFVQAYRRKQREKKRQADLDAAAAAPQHAHSASAAESANPLAGPSTEEPAEAGVAVVPAAAAEDNMPAYADDDADCGAHTNSDGDAHSAQGGDTEDPFA